jgi:hypothetical protein
MQAASDAVGKAPEIDWEAYGAQLPHIDIQALKKDYQAFVAAIPPIPYDEAKDLALHSSQVCCAASSPVVACVVACVLCCRVGPFA